MNTIMDLFFEDFTGKHYVGDFDCAEINLESLEGAPMRIGGDFYCDENLYNGDNLYIITNALLNGRKDKQGFEKKSLESLTKYFR